MVSKLISKPNSHKTDTISKIAMKFWIMPILVVLIFGAVDVFAQSIKHTIDGMDIEITHPDEIIIGRESSISILLKNNGWEDKQDISFKFSSHDDIVVTPSEINIEKLSQGGSYGSNINVAISNSANPSVNFLNLRYSQILVAHNETPQPATFHDIAIPITLKEQPNVTIHTKMPESIFSAAEFPIEIMITSEDIDIKDVSVKIIPPDDIEFRGETQHVFSTIKKDSPATITSRIITPPQEVNTEHRLPFVVIIEYTNDIGEEETDSSTLSLVLRPRVFMELTTEGGIWLGDFFIAPYVSLGTIIGIPAGALLTLIIRRRTSDRQKVK